MSADVRVAIVGAGPAGSALAVLLGEAGVSTALFDRATFPRDKTCGEGLMPSGARVLERLGVSLDRYPALRGVTYTVPNAGSAQGRFTEGASARGVRRLVLDEALAQLAASTRNVQARFDCAVSGIARSGAGFTVTTPSGVVSAEILVGADGLHSAVARWMGWARAPRRPYRYALVSHAAAPNHGLEGVVVTLLDGREVYTTPTSPDELLVGVLGTKSRLRRDGEPSRDAYARHVRDAHPELDVAGATVRGAGPFWTRPSRVARGGAFLIGDAAGFHDPLTGDGMSDALVGAAKLAGILSSHEADPARAYRRWEAGQWRRRSFVSRLALILTGSTAAATRALRPLQRRPATLNRLLQVNDGTRSVWSLSLRDWAALAGVS